MDIGKWKVTELKNALIARGLSIKGFKSTLIERLQAAISESDDNMIKLIVIVMKQFTMRALRKRVINVPILLEQLLNLTLTESENILQVKCYLVSFVTTN